MKKSCVVLGIVFIMMLCGPALAQSIWIGPTVPFQKTQIQNVTPFSCSLIASGKQFGLLTPGQTAYLGPGTKKWWKNVVSFHSGYGYYAGSSNVVIPVVALCFTDATNEYYIGEADTVFNIPGGGYSSTMTWIIRQDDIRCADTVPCHNPASPIEIGYGEKKLNIEFPTFWMEGMNGIQIVNNSELNFVLRTTRKQGDIVLVRPGEVYYLAMWGVQTVSVKIDAVNPLSEVFMGAWTTDFYGQSSGFQAQNIVLNRGSFH